MKACNHIRSEKDQARASKHSLFKTRTSKSERVFYLSASERMYVSSKSWNVETMSCTSTKTPILACLVWTEIFIAPLCLWMLDYFTLLLWTLHTIGWRTVRLLLKHIGLNRSKIQKLKSKNGMLDWIYQDVWNSQFRNKRKIQSLLASSLSAMKHHIKLLFERLRRSNCQYCPHYHLYHQQDSLHIRETFNKDKEWIY